MANQDFRPNQRETPLPDLNAGTGLEVGGAALFGAVVGSLLGPAGTYAGLVLGSFFGAKRAWNDGVKRAAR